MSLIWIVPPVVVIVGLAAALWLLRRIEVARADLAIALTELDTVTTPAAAVAERTSEARADLARLQRR